MNIKTIILMAVFAGILSSCNYKELDDEIILDTYPVKVDFSWENVDSIPNSFRLVVYPADKSTYINKEKHAVFDVYNKKHTIYLPVGNYNMVAWNNDGEHIITAGYDEQRTLYATTQSLMSQDSTMPNIIDSLSIQKDVRDYPDYLTHYVAEEFTVIKTDNGDDNTVMLHPDSMVIRVDVRVHGIGGLTWIRQARGLMNDVAAKRYLSYENLTEDSCAVMFDCDWKERDSLVYSTFYIFDKYDNLHKVKDYNKEKQQYMYLFFWLDQGNVYIPLNISKYLAARRDKDKLIVIDIPSLGIDLRNFMTSDSGFFISVDDWIGEYVDVDI
jgi:hypothetical protein